MTLNSTAIKEEIHRSGSTITYERVINAGYDPISDSVRQTINTLDVKAIFLLNDYTRRADSKVHARGDLFNSPETTLGNWTVAVACEDLPFTPTLSDGMWFQDGYAKFTAVQLFTYQNENIYWKLTT